MEIRTLDSDTIPDLVDSVAALFAEDGGTHDERMDTGWPVRDGTDYYTSFLDDPFSRVFLAWQENRCVGHLVGKINGPNPLRPGARVGVLESMRVDADSRGEGVGSALVGQFLDWARDNDVTEFQVCAYAANKRALAFYERLGFTAFEYILRMPR